MGHHVITTAGLKGGIAKTSVATNLAAWWSGAGQRVLLVDADANGSAIKLYERGERALLVEPSTCVPIQHAAMAMAKPWDLVVVDTAGGSRDEQLSYAEGSDFVIAPCQPAASSIEQVIDLADVIKRSGKPFGVLLTMCDRRRQVDARKTREVLERVGLPVLKSEITLLSAWPKAEAAGVAVRDARTDADRPDPGAAKAWEQVAALAAEINERLG